MSLIPSNIEILAFAYQSAKGTAATTPLIATRILDESLEINRQELTTAESDATGQQGDVGVVGQQPGGTFRRYVRASEDDFFLYGLLGKNADSGTTPKVHTASVDPAAPFTTPYVTCWQIWPGVATVRYMDARIPQGVFTRTPGAFLEVEYTLNALTGSFVTEPSYSSLLVDEMPLSGSEFAATIGGSDPKTINACSLTISRNGGRYPGDNGLSDYDVPNQLLAVSGSMEVSFEDDDLLRAANTGTTSGTDVTTIVYDRPIVITYSRSASLQIVATLAAAQIRNYRKGFRADGSPATASFDFQSKRASSIVDQIQTVTKNAVALAARA